MPIPFVQTINDNTPNLTLAQKQALLADWCAAKGYEDMILDSDTGTYIPNPETRVQFMDRMLAVSIKNTIVQWRRHVQTQTIVVEEPDI